MSKDIPPRLRVSAACGIGMVLATLTSTLASGVEITMPRTLPQGTVGQAYALPLHADGGVVPYAWSLVNPGYWYTRASDMGSFDLDGGTLIALPTAAGLYAVPMVVQDADGGADEWVAEIRISDPKAPVLVGPHATLPSGTSGLTSLVALSPAGLGQPYEVDLYSTGGTAPFTWSVLSGGVPPGMAVSSGGALSGTPTKAGAYAFTVQAQDAKGATGSGRIALTVDDLSQPLDVQIIAGQTVRAAVPNIGHNLTSNGRSVGYNGLMPPNQGFADDLMASYAYYADVGNINQYILNPGFEPAQPYREMFTAWTGSANTLEEWDLVQYAGPARPDLISGFWNGGTYWVLSGPAKGRTGTIQSYQVVTDASAPNGVRGVWTLADSNPNMVVQSLTASSDFGERDIFMVEAPAANAVASMGTTPPGWNILQGSATATYGIDTQSFVTGTQSARIDSQGGNTGLWQTLFWDNPWCRFRPDTTYTFSVYARQHGLSDGMVSVSLAPSYSHDFQVPDDGQFHKLTGQFEGQGQAAPALNFQVSIDAAGTVWLDNALLWESTATVTPAAGPASAPVSSAPFDPLPFVVDDLKRDQVGTLRLWFYDFGLTLADALAAPSQSAPGSSHNLFSLLSLAEKVGTSPWIVAEKEWMPLEFEQLAEYLASPDTSQGMGQLRASQGHPMPWTQTLPHIYIEYSDEAWNSPNYAYPFNLWHQSVYASFVQERFNAIRQSPYYENMTLIADGQAGDDFWVNSIVDADAYPSQDALDGAPYLTPNQDQTFDQLPGSLAQTVMTLDGYMAGTLAAFKAKGHATQLYVYESGPSPGGSWTGPLDEVRKGSLLLATAYIDEVAAMFSSGLGAFNDFIYENSGLWQDITGPASRFHSAVDYAVRMFNQAFGGADELGVLLPSPAPALPLTTCVLDTGGGWCTGDYEPVMNDGGAPSDGGIPSLQSVPAISVHAYARDGAIGFLLVNRSAQVAYPVRLPAVAGLGYEVTTLKGRSAFSGTFEGPGYVASSSAERDTTRIHEVVAPTTSAQVASTASLDVTLPPGALVTIVPIATNADGGEASDAGSARDAGRDLDAGASTDAGGARDAGELIDAGEPPDDAGEELDGGLSSDGGDDLDAGELVDAGGPDDGGGSLDAGIPDGGPAFDAGTRADAGASKGGPGVDAGPTPQEVRAAGCHCSSAGDLSLWSLGLLLALSTRRRAPRRRLSAPPRV